MKRVNSVILLCGAGWILLASSVGIAQKPSNSAAPQRAPAAARTPRPIRPAPTSVSAAASAADQNTVVRRYCVTCHSDTRNTGGLSLASFDVAHAAENAELAERIIRKLQAGMMPPPLSPRPDAATHAALINTLESRIDTAAAAKPNPGARTFQRLNRPEYSRAVRDLVALDVDAANWLPLDQKSANFDNIADVQSLSPTLLEAYLNAASAISAMAIGDRHAPTVDHTFTNPGYLSQHPWDHVDGAPFGTRGGMVVNHVFPADAEYVFEMALNSGSNTRFEDIDISVNGERVALVQYETGPAGGADGRGAVLIRTEPIRVRAGQQRVAAAFVRKMEGPYEDLIRPHDWSFAGGGSGGPGITTLPHVRDLVIKGPYKATGISETPSRQKIFSCRPTGSDEERPCARQIIARLGSEAYRRPLDAGEIDRLMPFFENGANGSGGSGRSDRSGGAGQIGLPAHAGKAGTGGVPAEARRALAGGFEAGIRSALEAILASPHFIFRLEREPVDARPGATYRVADVDLASRLSFFLWGSLPDQELLALATQNKLSAPGMLEKQTRRMLADPRADALGSRFAAQWLRLQDVEKVHPDPNFYPDYDDNLAGAMRRETELFFNNLVREDRSLLELFTADYTFVNERLARHYGIPGVSGSEFRKVGYPDDTRRGLLGQGSVLVQTSLANRTSPVLRGKWVMEVLMGTPPPPAPPDIPALEETASARDGKMLTTRERMEMHRSNPTCNSCHRFMDPIGLALDNFDVTAKWRARENGMPLDTNGDYYDGTPVARPAELLGALMKRPVPLVRTFTENLFAYALGRRSEYFDQPAIRAIAKAAEANHYRMSSFILGVVKSDAFQLKRAEPITTDSGDSRR
jgi:cytochrome c551/c552